MNPLALTALLSALAVPLAVLAGHSPLSAALTAGVPALVLAVLALGFDVRSRR